MPESGHELAVVVKGTRLVVRGTEEDPGAVSRVVTKLPPRAAVPNVPPEAEAVSGAIGKSVGLCVLLDHPIGPLGRLDRIGHGGGAIGRFLRPDRRTMYRGVFSRHRHDPDRAFCREPGPNTGDLIHIDADSRRGSQAGILKANTLQREHRRVEPGLGVGHAVRGNLLE
jgi:hypothetical protein